MSVCFYHNAGKMLGADVHKGFPMLVFTEAYLIWPGTWDKNTDSVSADSLKMIQHDYDLWLIPHIPPGPEAVPDAMEATATASSKPFMSKQSVSGEGAPLACCVKWSFGLNSNCWAWALLDPSLPESCFVSALW
jgi:hypothetical protein